MKITLVADVFGQTNNGTAATASRLVEYMTKFGHEVTIVSTYKGDDINKYYTVGKRNFLIFNNYIEKSNGVALGKPEKDKIWKAIKDADVVHFLLPFKMSKVGIKMCLEHNIPFTTAFHCQPENITSHLFLQKNKFVNKLIYKKMNKSFYKNANIIHCPSKFIADKLNENNYKAKKYVISNGVQDVFVKTESEKPENLKDKFCIFCSGRYSSEKRQDLIINAIKHCKNEKNIQLILAGNGPKRKKYEKLGNALTNKPIFCFLNKSELVKTINYCDLYIHASDIEIEGIGCMEAISCGLVPILSDSNNAALKQFALTEDNLFKAGDFWDLAKKIDFWYENPEKKQVLSVKYIAFMQNFRIEKCMRQMEKMFQDAINSSKK